MASRTRIANKLIWGLEDILTEAAISLKILQKMAERAERQMDPVAALEIMKLTQALATIERKARAAREGDYRD